MTTLDEIERKAKAYADARHAYSYMVQVLNEALEALKREHLPGIKRAISNAMLIETELRLLVEGSPHLFLRPRTVVLHGVRVGFAKGKGRIEYEDADKVVALIDKKLPELADELVRTERKPLKSALERLTVQQLRAIGCTVEEAGDRVVVRAEDTDIDRLVTALLAER